MMEAYFCVNLGFGVLRNNLLFMNSYFSGLIDLPGDKDSYFSNNITLLLYHRIYEDHYLLQLIFP